MKVSYRSYLDLIWPRSKPKCWALGKRALIVLVRVWRCYTLFLRQDAFQNGLGLAEFSL